ncbi:hypothetical protein Tco_0235929, partial [Tanacetum coccineum]
VTDSTNGVSTASTNLVLPVLSNIASRKELVLPMVKAVELKIRMHGDYYGMVIFELDNGVGKFSEQCVASSHAQTRRAPESGPINRMKKTVPSTAERKDCKKNDVKDILPENAELQEVKTQKLESIGAHQRQGAGFQATTPWPHGFSDNEVNIDDSLKTSTKGTDIAMLSLPLKLWSDDEDDVEFDPRLKRKLLSYATKKSGLVKPDNTVRRLVRQTVNTGRQNVNTVGARGFNASNSQLNDNGFVIVDVKALDDGAVLVKRFCGDLLLESGLTFHVNLGPPPEVLQQNEACHPLGVLPTERLMDLPEVALLAPSFRTGANLYGARANGLVSTGDSYSQRSLNGPNLLHYVAFGRPKANHGDSLHLEHRGLGPPLWSPVTISAA